MVVPDAFIELTDDGIREDLATIMQSMERIRRQKVFSGHLSDTEQDEYLNLAYRAGSCIEELAGRRVYDNLETMVDYINKNGAALSYDPAFSRFWDNVAPEFVDALEFVTFAILQDRFCNSSYNYHILQGVKFLGINGISDIEEKTRILDTIKPFADLSLHGDYFKDLITKAGIPCVELIGDNKVIIEDSLDVDKHCSSIAEMGLVPLIAKDDRFANEDERNSKKGYLRYPFIERESRFGQVVGKIVKYSKPLSYLVLGGLPGSWQKGIGQYFEECGIKKAYDPKSAALYQNIIFNTGLLFAGGIGMLKADSVVGPLLLGWYAVINGIGRIGFGIDNKHRYVVGDLTGELVSYVSGNKYGQLQNPIIIEPDCDLPDEERYYEGPMEHCQWDYIQGASIADLGSKIEANLDMQIGNGTNYHQFCKRFQKALFDATVYRLSGFDGKTHIDRKNEAWSLYETLDTGKYDKVTALICQEGERVAVSYITPKKDGTDIQSINDAILGNIGDEQRIEALRDATGARYIHYIRCVPGDIICDMTGI